MNINKVILAGRLTRDPELKTVGQGSTVATIGCAINRRVKRHGEWADEPVFVDVSMWGARAEAFCKYHSKGDKFCFPDAELVWEKWTDKQGNERTKLYVQANSWEFCNEKKGDSAQQVEADAPF